MHLSGTVEGGRRHRPSLRSAPTQNFVCTPLIGAPHGAFILANASCIGSAETTIIPSNGESISTMRTTAPAIERAPTNSAITTNILRGAKRPKLTNNTNNHTIMINTNGCGTCSDSTAAWSQVVFARSAAVCDALAASERWDSVLGANSVKLCCKLSSNFQAGGSLAPGLGPGLPGQVSAILATVYL